MRINTDKGKFVKSILNYSTILGYVFVSDLEKYHVWLFKSSRNVQKKNTDI